MVAEAVEDNDGVTEPDMVAVEHNELDEDTVPLVHCDADAENDGEPVLVLDAVPVTLAVTHADVVTVCVLVTVAVPETVDHMDAVNDAELVATAVALRDVEMLAVWLRDTVGVTDAEAHGVAIEEAVDAEELVELNDELDDAVAAAEMVADTVPVAE